ncbi:hypothetical protein CR513_41912, partial [Mucuna pruriens]
MNSAWKHMRIPGSINLEERIPSWLGSVLFNARLKLITSKLCSKWTGPFVITKIFPYGAVELHDELTRSTFQVNGQQLKNFHGSPTTKVGEVESISLDEQATTTDTPYATLKQTSLCIPIIH